MPNDIGRTAGPQLRSILDEAVWHRAFTVRLLVWIRPSPTCPTSA